MWFVFGGNANTTRVSISLCWILGHATYLDARFELQMILFLLEERTRVRMKTKINTVRIDSWRLDSSAFCDTLLRYEIIDSYVLMCVCAVVCVCVCVSMCVTTKKEFMAFAFFHSSLSPH